MLGAERRLTRSTALPEDFMLTSFVLMMVCIAVLVTGLAQVRRAAVERGESTGLGGLARTSARRELSNRRRAYITFLVLYSSLVIASAGYRDAFLVLASCTATRPRRFRSVIGLARRKGGGVHPAAQSRWPELQKAWRGRQHPQLLHLPRRMPDGQPILLVPRYIGDDHAATWPNFPRIPE